MRRRFRLSCGTLYWLLPLLLGAAPVAAARVAGEGRSAILFVSVDESGSEEVRTVEVAGSDGTGRRKLGLGDSASWSPDGTRIAFGAYREDTGSRDLFVRIADGNGQVRLTRTPDDEVTADWSPDGRLLAFTGGGQSPEVRVVAADGTGTRTISPGVHLSWSPDGSRLASLRGTDVWITRRDGSASASLGKLVDESQIREVELPVWSPDSSRLAFVVDGDLWVVPADGGAAARITKTENDTEENLRWSPDGRTIAYVLRPYNPNSLPTLWVAHLDQGVTRRLGDVGAIQPAWTPDGRTIVFVRGGVGNCGYKIGCDLEGRPDSGSSPLNGIYAIRADGTGQRRLTTNYDLAPIVSPAGSNILFSRIEEGGYVEELRVIGLSGGCTRKVARMSVAESVAWNPRAPALSPIHCVDLKVFEARRVIGAPGEPFAIEYVVRNTGDRPATDVRLAVSLPPIIQARPSARCRVTTRSSRWSTAACRLRPIPPGKQVRITVEGRVSLAKSAVFKNDRTFVRTSVSARATSRGNESDSLNNTVDTAYSISLCTRTGTRSNDLLTGTAGSDYLCGGFGSDRLRGFAGDDVLDGGVDADRLEPGSGHDVVRARGGDDVVLAADGQRDIVACGAGEDRVVADELDRVDGSCERVQRSR